ncbi:MAG: hypothetical protein ACK5K7_05840 [Bacilli bacterium]
MIKVLTEGNKQKGFGHIYRCMTIVNEINASIYIDSDEDLTKIFEGSNVVSWQNEDWVLSNIESTDIIIVDSYHVSIDVLNLINKLSNKCIVIDDLFRFDYRNFIILNPNNFGDGVNYHSSNTILGGSKYMLTRKEFNGSRRNFINKDVTNIFVMIGATDILNVGEKLYEFFVRDLDFKNITINMVSNSNLKSTENINVVSGLDGKAICDLMLASDFSITAGGQTLNELIKTTTPFICVEVASNQRSNIDGILSKDYGMEFTSENLEVIKSMFDYNIRQVFYNNMKKVHYEYNGAYYLKEFLEDCNE